MIEHNISLKPYNTFGIDVHAKAFGRFTSVEELKDLLVKNQLLYVHLSLQLALVKKELGQTKNTGLPKSALLQL